jgi:hypothetical protein
MNRNSMNARQRIEQAKFRIFVLIERIYDEIAQDQMCTACRRYFSKKMSCEKIAIQLFRVGSGSGSFCK